MENFLIIAIIVVAVVLSLRSTAKHFKGQGGCCGGGSYRPKRKKLKKVLYRKQFRVEGMHCEHCQNRVEETVNDIPGVAGRVDLKKGLLTVSYAEDVADSVIFQAIEKAGYHITEA